ncbi:MAG: phage major capsid protein [Gammaproteobacteria bacterium]|nr:MAG: phage major capsid protein [Gammaproteobacteria bacterium]
MEMTQSQLTEMITNAVKAFHDKGEEKTEKKPTPIVAPSGMKRDLTQVDKGELNLSMGRIMRALIGGGGSAAGAIEYSKSVFGDGPDSLIQKILIVGSDPAGGFLVPDEVSTMFLDLLLPFAVVRSMNPTLMPMSSGNMTINGGDTGPSASYIGEAKKIPVSGATFRRVNLSAKKLVGMVPISNDLIRTSSPAADKVVAKWLFQAMANREDLAFIRGDGATNTPQGLLHLAGLVRNMTGTGTLAQVEKDFSALKLYMRQANLPMDSLGYLISPRIEDFLWLLAHPTNGTYPFRDGIDKGTINNHPYACTTQIPEDLGGGTESEVYFCNFSDVVIGDTMSAKMDVSTEASYEDGGVQVSAYQQDLTLLRTISEHDINTLRAEAITVLDKVTWGA